MNFINSLYIQNVFSSYLDCAFCKHISKYAKISFRPHSRSFGMKIKSGQVFEAFRFSPRWLPIVQHHYIVFPALHSSTHNEGCVVCMCQSV